MVLGKGEVQQFSKKLRCMPEKRRADFGGGDQAGGGRYIPSWKLMNQGSRSLSSGSGGRSLSGRTGSDGPSWRKEAGGKAVEKGAARKGEEEEVERPLKNVQNRNPGVLSKKVLFIENEKEKDVDVLASGVKADNGVKLLENTGEAGAVVGSEVAEGEGDVNRALQPMHVDGEELVRAAKGQQIAEELGEKPTRWARTRKDIAPMRRRSRWGCPLVWRKSGP